MKQLITKYGVTGHKRYDCYPTELSQQREVFDHRLIHRISVFTNMATSLWMNARPRRKFSGPVKDTPEREG